MKFKLWSDTNMVNCSVRLEMMDVRFKADLLKNIITVDHPPADVVEAIREEGGEEVK
jgi:hypothetical protein